MVFIIKCPNCNKLRLEKPNNEVNGFICSDCGYVFSATKGEFIKEQRLEPKERLFDGVDTYICPNCEEEIYDDEYCCNCGQKLII